MAYARAVSKASWIGLSASDEPAIRRAVSELVRAGPCASVFLCSSRIDLEWAAIGLSATRARKKHFDYVEITDADLAEADVPVLETEGLTPFPRANALHRELDLADGRADHLVRVLARREAFVVTMRIDELRAIVRNLVRNTGTLVATDHWLRG